MGLDAVEVIMRCEELFAITIADPEAAQVRTVRDLYTLICGHLHLAPAPHPIIPDVLPVITREHRLGFLRRNYEHLAPPPELLPWTPESVWAALVAIFVDQLALKPEDIEPHARIADDLRVD